MTLAEQGDVLVLDCRVFHRAGVDGTHHVEEAVEYVVMDDPDERAAAACVLTVDQEADLRPSLAGVLHDLALPLAEGEDAVLDHPAVAAVRDVRRE